MLEVDDVRRRRAGPSPSEAEESHVSKWTRPVLIRAINAGLASVVPRRRGEIVNREVRFPVSDER
jgi:hypothetical protein